MWKNYFMPETVEEALKLLDEGTENTRLIAGGTDLMVEIRNKKWPRLETIIDISRVRGLNQIYQDEEGLIHIQAMVTHNDVLKSELVREFASPLYQACYKVATPQIRNRATVVGNLVTASPANDTITPLMSMDAALVLVSSEGERIVRLKDFYHGVRKTELKPTEIVREVLVRPLGEHERGSFIKQALRKAQAISVLNCCVLLELEHDLILNARVTMGSVAPTIIHSPGAEEYLVGKRLDRSTAKEAGVLAAQDIRPISDVRAGEDYRRYMMQVIVEDALLEILEGRTDSKIPQHPVTLTSKEEMDETDLSDWDGSLLKTNINGEELQFSGDFRLSLLNFIRERVGYTGPKPGCEEGECGACTIHMDGKAVVSCLIPAPRAHHAKIKTIEGLAPEGQLHPLQEEFINQGAVQCGYCTPGFLMSAAKLMEEKENPDLQDIKDGISGNLCRCTGYYKIIEAIEAAFEKRGGTQ